MQREDGNPGFEWSFELPPPRGEGRRSLGPRAQRSPSEPGLGGLSEPDPAKAYTLAPTSDRPPSPLRGEGRPDLGHARRVDRVRGEAPTSRVMASQRVASRRVPWNRLTPYPAFGHLLP